MTKGVVVINHKGRTWRFEIFLSGPIPVKKNGNLISRRRVPKAVWDKLGEATK